MSPPTTSIFLATAAVLVGCSRGPAASNDTLADRRPAPSPAERYALGVVGGTCPPDVAFYHARGSAGKTELGIVASRGQLVSYSVASNDPRYDGRRDQAIVPAGENGRTFAIDIPVAAIVSILVSASGSATERSGSCSAVRL
jgi:hypothetical protein